MSNKIDWDRVIPKEVAEDEPTRALMKVAYIDGLQAGLKELLDHLQSEFFKPKTKPGTPEYQNYLDIIRTAGAHIHERLEETRTATSPDS